MKDSTVFCENVSTTDFAIKRFSDMYYKASFWLLRQLTFKINATSCIENMIMFVYEHSVQMGVGSLLACFFDQSTNWNFSHKVEYCFNMEQFSHQPLLYLLVLARCVELASGWKNNKSDPDCEIAKWQKRQATDMVVRAYRSPSTKLRS